MGETPITWTEAMDLHATDDAPEKKATKDEDLEIGSPEHKDAIKAEIEVVAKHLRDMIRTARKHGHTNIFLMEAFKDRLLQFATVDMARIGVPPPSYENLRMELGVLEKMRFDVAFKFFFESTKRGGEVPHTARGAAAIMAVAKADALLEALGYDVDLELSHLDK